MTSARKKTPERAELEALSVNTNEVLESKLRRLLGLHEFYPTKKTGGSHHGFKNKKLGIYCRLVQVHGSNKPIDTNKEIANACMKVQDRWEEIALSVLNTPAVEEATSSPFVQIEDVLPDRFSSSGLQGHENGVILRCKDMSCVGAVAPIQATQQELDMIFEDLDEKKRAFEEDLSVAVEMYELNLELVEGGVLMLRSSPYMMTEVFRPYTPISPDPSLKLESMIGTVESIDSLIYCLASEFMKEAKQTETTDAGFTVWTQTRTHAFTWEERDVSLAISPMGRVSLVDMAEFLDIRFDFKFGMNGRAYDFKAMLKRHGGFDVRLGKEDEDGKIVITHPFYPDFRVTAPFYTKNINLRAVWKSALEGAENAEESSAQLAAFIETVGEPTNFRGGVEIEADKALVALTDFLTETLKPNVVRFADIHEPALSRGFVTTADDKRLESFGKPGRITYVHPLTQKRVTVNAVYVQINTGKTYCILPADLERLEEDLRQAERVPSGLQIEIPSPLDNLYRPGDDSIFGTPPSRSIFRPDRPDGPT